MYEYFCAVVVGIVEGLTEYIPVSSTGHMIIVGHMLGFEGTLADLFDVFIQLGAILSVLVVYREKFKFILNTHHWFRRRGPSVLNVAISMFPACLMGLIFHDFIKHKLFSPYTVIIGLVLGGVFMIFAEKKRKKFTVTDVDRITSRQALKIGFFPLAGIFQERKYDSRKPAAWHIQKSGSRFYFYYGCTSYVSCMYIRFNQSYPIFTNK